MNFAVLVALSCIAFGVGFLVGEAKSFNFFKLFIVFIFGIPLLYSSENDYYTTAVAISFISGLFFAYKDYIFDLLDEVKYRLNYFSGFFNRASVREQRSEEDHHQEQHNNFYDEEIRREQERRQQEAEQRRTQSNKNKKSNTNQSRKSRDKTQEEPKQRRHTKEKQGRRQEQNKKSYDQTTSKPKEYQADKRTPQEILGLNDGFTLAELKKAYKLKRSQMHPDKWATEGQEAVDLMTEKFKRVTEAYNKLLKRF